MSLFNRYLRKVAEQTLYATPVLYEFSKKAPLPGNAGKTIFIPKHYGRNGIRALSETKTSKILTCATSTHYYSATVAGYGDARSYSDFLVAIKEIPTVLEDDIRSMTEFAGQKVDSLIRTQICGAGNWVSPDGSTANTDVIETTQLKQRFLFDAYSTLAGLNCPKYSDGSFWGAFHPHAIHDLFVGTSSGSTNLGAGFMELTDLGAKKLENATIGKLAGVRVVETTSVPKIANGVGGISEGANSGYASFVMGPGAVGAVDLQNSKLQTIIKGLGSAGTADPVNQEMTAGVKFYFAAVAMDTTNRLVRTASGSTI
jgi:N4-gp56 family major capsid protein